jgi:RNA polymerase sigma-70 factor, ECF subfamily
VTDNAGESTYEAEAESLTLTCLVLLEQLLPVERAAFLLHHVFGRSRTETAGMVGVSDATCRRLLRRGQLVMSAAKPAIEAERVGRDVVTTRFVTAVREGDVQLLAELLAPDAVAYVDATPTAGRWAVACLLDRSSADLAFQPDAIVLEICDGLVHTVRWAAREQ